MGDQYSEHETSILIFGPNRDGVLDFTSEARDILQKKGVEYDGPIPLPKISMSDDDEAFSDDGAEVFGHPPSEEELKTLPGTTVFRRLLRVYGDGDVISEILSKESADKVFFRVLLDVRSHQKGGKGTPHTYDPRIDYKTEL
ncbi:hypothetical protein [Haloplanus salinarum]|uniref:hypothetical protein n=1 Tax=Haloplanus salinarum TaxID=1912324 RepID=UPI00214B7965|nr:hypothetical protein [Haloplanus salinarum]